LAIGLSALGYCAAVLLEATFYQAYQTWSFEQELHGKTRLLSGFGNPHESRAVRGANSNAPGTITPESAAPFLVGKLEIPRLGLVTMVFEGVDAGTLRRAVGHIPDTALPGEPGNVAIAGHRDTFFRPLRNIHKGDEIALTTMRGRYRYRVESINVVSPDDTQVLEPSSRPILTLVTCYPFYFVGAAPKRLVVRGQLVDG